MRFFFFLSFCSVSSFVSHHLLRWIGDQWKGLGSYLATGPSLEDGRTKVSISNIELKTLGI